MTRSTGAVSDVRGSDAERLLGRDIRFVESARSTASAPLVDWGIDPKSPTDFATIGGLPNFVQALQLRAWTEQGTYLLDSGYGLPPAWWGGRTSRPRSRPSGSSWEATIRADPRVEQVLAIVPTVDGDVADFDVTLLPVGHTQPTTVSTAVV